MRDFEELQVGKKAHALTLAVYAETHTFPTHEQFGLTSQIRRSSSSIGYNIAEGCGRDSDPDFARSLQIAAGSASEVEYQLLLARDLGYLETTKHLELRTACQEVRRMLYAFIEYLRR
jgi:four helix bundle protein